MPEADELGLVLAAIPDGIIVQDADGRFIYANDAAARAAGFATASDMVGASLADVVARYSFWDEAGQLLQLDDLPGRQAMRGKRAEGVLRYRGVDIGGGGPESEERWVSVVSVPIVDASGRVHRVVSVMHDVTEERRGEE